MLKLALKFVCLYGLKCCCVEHEEYQHACVMFTSCHAEQTYRKVKCATRNVFCALRFLYNGNAPHIFCLNRKLLKDTVVTETMLGQYF